MKKFTYSFLFAIIASLLLDSTAVAQNIAQRGTGTTSTTTSTTLTITKPTGLAIGDVMFANIVQGDNDANQALGDASGSGWTFVRGGLLGTSG
ncbi:MAG: hypothetical protein WBA96_03810, partial [Chitinophagaceae bacterium]